MRRLTRSPDERGAFGEIMRADWADLLGSEKMVQANLSVSFPGVVRAWHRHARGQSDYFFVIEGTLKICAFDEKSGELDEIITDGELPQVVRIPGHFWHGFKAAGPGVAKLVYFVDRLYDYTNPDEERKPWDGELIPKSINGKREDPRVGRRWDWDESPNK